VRHSFVAGNAVVTDYALPWLDMNQLAADAVRVVDRIARRT